MADKIESLFSTRILTGSLKGQAALNRRLLAEVKSYSKEDKFGRDWSRENYPGGYTSYASLNNMQHRSRAFMDFAEAMLPHAKKFAKVQGWDLKGLELEMTDCWMNIMPKGASHSLHLHPHSIISGAYYITAPKGSSTFRIEDPRMSFYMNAPLRSKAGPKDGLYYSIPAQEGGFVLFESWLRHEVQPNRSSSPRISLSFNFSAQSTDPDLR